MHNLLEDANCGGATLRWKERTEWEKKNSPKKVWEGERKEHRKERDLPKANKRVGGGRKGKLKGKTSEGRT